jgi:hypothetical protein
MITNITPIEKEIIRIMVQPASRREQYSEGEIRRVTRTGASSVGASSKKPREKDDYKRQ